MLKYQEVSRDFNKILDEWGWGEILPEELLLLDEQAIEVVYVSDEFQMTASADCKLKFTKKEIYLQSLKDDTFEMTIPMIEVINNNPTQGGILKDPRYFTLIIGKGKKLYIEVK